jgi:rod shape-determining protein MreC
MAKNQIRMSNRVLFILLSLTGLIFLFAPQNFTNKFQFAFARVFRWPLSLGRNISLAARTYQPVKQMLKQREIQYQNHVDNLEELLRQERRKVQKLSGLRERLPLESARLVLAAVSMEPEGMRNELIINRGRDDGLTIGQFVLGDNSIVGTVSDVSSRTARVRLFTDLASKIAVKVGASNVERIMQGNGNNSAVVRMMKQKVKTGDKVFARQKQGFLDAPMIIGKVARCERNEGSPLLWDVTVEPVCDVEKLNDVAVIVMNSGN